MLTFWIQALCFCDVVNIWEYDPYMTLICSAALTLMAPWLWTGTSGGSTSCSSRPLIWKKLFDTGNTPRSDNVPEQIHFLCCWSVKIHWNNFNGTKGKTWFGWKWKLKGAELCLSDLSSLKMHYFFCRGCYCEVNHLSWRWCFSSRYSPLSKTARFYIDHVSRRYQFPAWFYDAVSHIFNQAF